MNLTDNSLAAQLLEAGSPPTSMSDVALRRPAKVQGIKIASADPVNTSNKI
jgi:hypothetical protein